MNLLLQSDSYKYTHYKQYPPGTEKVYSYLESRGGVFDSTIFFGLQYYLEKFLNGVRVNSWDLAEAEQLINSHLGLGNFNYSGWEHIMHTHGGFLPLEIRAVPEGLDVPNGNVLMTVVNTDPQVPWLTNFVETLLMKLWYPITVATLSNRIRALILRYLEKTGDPAGIDFKLHDFGYRGVSSEESAAIGGLAHLVNFRGTDTVAAILAARKYYDCGCAGFSIPATEHSTITSWGRAHEVAAYRNFLDQFPTGLIACVSDSYNIYTACRELWGGELRERVLERDGCLVIRPDSGTPHDVVLSVVRTLDQAFGHSLNKKGFKVLDPHVRVLQGDGVNYDSIVLILSTLQQAGYSADNIAFGMGGALLQQLHRDTQKMAFKCSAVQVNGQWRGVYKDPVDDRGKRSKRGLLSLVKRDGKFTTVSDRQDSEEDYLQAAFLNGKLCNPTTLQHVREVACRG